MKQLLKLSPSSWPVRSKGVSSAPFKGRPYHLTVNCRNTLPIAQRVAAVFGDTVETRGEIGPEPVFHTIGASTEVESVLGKTIRDLCGTEGGMEPRDIVILVPTRTWLEA